MEKGKDGPEQSPDAPRKGVSNPVKLNPIALAATLLGIGRPAVKTELTDKVFPQKTNLSTTQAETIRANVASRNAARDEQRRRDMDATGKKWRAIKEDDQRRKDMYISKPYEIFPIKEPVVTLKDEIKRANEARIHVEGLESKRRAQDKLREK